MIPVRDLYSACEMMLRDKWGYIWGASGELWTQKKQDAATREMTVKYGSRWIGHHVVDCSGVMVYIWRQHGMSIYHGSNTIRKKYCGPLQDTPAPGYAAFKVKGDDYHHIGIVAEDGLNVYEAKGTQTGFVLSAASSWDCFAAFNDVNYSDTAETEDKPMDQYLAIVDTQQGSLNIREKPTTDSKILFRVGKGQAVWVMEDMGNGWARVDDDGMQGYASLKYLKKASESAQDGPDGGGVQTPTDEQEAPENVNPAAFTRYAVFIPCDSEEEARRYAGNIKGAILIRYEKPPGMGGEGE